MSVSENEKIKDGRERSRNSKRKNIIIITICVIFVLRVAVFKGLYGYLYRWWFILFFTYGIVIIINDALPNIIKIAKTSRDKIIKNS